MARLLRIEFAGALHHVTSRGKAKQNVYFEDADRIRFLEILALATEHSNWLCHTYCLMNDHYHLLIETPDGNLSQGMRQLNGVYTQYVNRKNKRAGPLFQGRYKSILVEKEAYLLELARHVVLNPVRAGMVENASQWPWSSYPAIAGKVKPPSFLYTDWLLAAFEKQGPAAVKRYKKFVKAGKNQPGPWGSLRNRIYLGTESFVEEIQQNI